MISKTANGCKGILMECSRGSGQGIACDFLAARRRASSSSCLLTSRQRGRKIWGFQSRRFSSASVLRSDACPAASPTVHCEPQLVTGRYNPPSPPPTRMKTPKLREERRPKGQSVSRGLQATRHPAPPVRFPIRKKVANCEQHGERSRRRDRDQPTRIGESRQDRRTP